MTAELGRRVGAVGPPDAAAAAAARDRQRRLTKPAGALGRLEELSVWLAAVQGRCPPADIDTPMVAVFAADHGVAAHGVSAYPPEVTAQMTGNFAAGGAAVNVLARLAGAQVRVVDVGVGRPSGRIDIEDALSGAAATAAFGVGASVADHAVDAGADLLIAGDMGIGNTTPAAAVTAALLGVDPASVVGRGTGVDDAAFARKSAVVTAAVRRIARDADAMTVLAAVGGADIAAAAGLLLAATARRTPVLLDGVISTTAALVVTALAPTAVAWWWAAHRSTEPAQRAALDRLGLVPLLDLDLRLGEGTGALLALPLLNAAAATLREMATFDEAGVSDRSAT